MTHLVPEHQMAWPNVCCRCGIHPIETWLPSGDGNQDGYCGECEGLATDAQERAEAEPAWEGRTLREQDAIRAERWSAGQ